MEINSPSITLRPFNSTDADDFMLFAGDDQVTQPLNWNTFTSKEEALTYINNVCLPHLWRRSICIDDRSIGLVALTPGSGCHRCRADIGYGLAVKYWGQGIATKALKLAIPLVFKDFPDLVRLQAYVDAENKASQRVLEKAAFLQDGLLRKYIYHNGKIVDLFLYSILSTDFPAP